MVQFSASACLFNRHRLTTWEPALPAMCQPLFKLCSRPLRRRAHLFSEALNWKKIERKRRYRLGRRRVDCSCARMDFQSRATERVARDGIGLQMSRQRRTGRGVFCSVCFKLQPPPPSTTKCFARHRHR